ncbi:MAG: hypothetical protein H6736_02210 [Alphaproteobacteria bacterium]|nr:hypothetical protein [Alphaproteobacteria bacterium]MCB9690604.1 hypothetical protein [Alphaproteobacteria bacterium]
MGELIRVPEANPFHFGLANLLGFGGAGYWWMGQKRKAVIAWCIVLLGGTCTLGMLYVFAFIAAYDAYLLGQRLQLGESVGETQNGLPFLDAIFR